MTLHTEILFLHPAPNVVFGMPIFVSRDAALMRAMLRNHGEWWDNASAWHARYCSDPVQFELCVEFGHLPRGQRYVDLLAPKLPDEWTLTWPIALRWKESWRAERAIDLLRRLRAWLSIEDKAPALVDVDDPGPLAKQTDFGSPATAQSRWI